MHKSKVFGIGLQKTGTSTLGKVLSHLGYSVNQTDYELMPKLMQGDYESIKNKTKLYDAFEDNPWPMLYKELDSWYPEGKFILTVRDSKNWIKSIIKHYGKRSFTFEKWYYEADYPLGNENHYIKKFEQHNQNVKIYFGDRPNKLLVIDWEKGDGWKEICEFLGKPIPDIPLPHLNKNKTLLDYVKKRYRGGLIRLKRIRSKYF